MLNVNNITVKKDGRLMSKFYPHIIAYNQQD